MLEEVSHWNQDSEDYVPEVSEDMRTLLGAVVKVLCYVLTKNLAARSQGLRL